MKVLNIDTMHNPDYYRNIDRQLIVIDLDLETSLVEFERRILFFLGRLNRIFPNLKQRYHYIRHSNEFCQQNFFSKIIIAIALELQTQADMPVTFGYGITSAISKVERIVFEYQIFQAGCYAIRAALKICRSLLEGDCYARTELEIDLDYLRSIKVQATLRLTASMMLPISF